MIFVNILDVSTILKVRKQLFINIGDIKESILNLPTLTKDEILHYNQNWTDLVTRQMPWRDQMAYGMRRKYGKFFHMDKKLPKVKAFLDNNRYAHGSRRMVAKALGF